MVSGSMPSELTIAGERKAALIGERLGLTMPQQTLLTKRLQDLYRSRLSVENIAKWTKKLLRELQIEVQIDIIAILSEKDGTDLAMRAPETIACETLSSKSKVAFARAERIAAAFALSDSERQRLTDAMILWQTRHSPRLVAHLLVRFLLEKLVVRDFSPLFSIIHDETFQGDGFSALLRKELMKKIPNDTPHQLSPGYTSSGKFLNDLRKHSQSKTEKSPASSLPNNVPGGGDSHLGWNKEFDMPESDNS